MSRIDFAETRSDNGVSTRARKRKQVDQDVEITPDIKEWTCLSSMYFMSNERLTRGMLRKDIDEATNELSYAQTIGKFTTENNSLVRVYEVQCSRECFPLLQYNCTLAGDIVTKYGNMRDSLAPRKRSNTTTQVPDILQSKELRFTVVTDGNIKDDLSLIVRKDNLRHTKCTDITGKSNQALRLLEARGSYCCIIFEHSGVRLDVQAKCIIRTSPTAKPLHRPNGINEIECDMTEKALRKRLTHFLSETLFSYAEDIVEKIHKLALPGKEDSRELIQQAEQAANALLNRKVTQEPSKSSKASCIPNEVATRLTRLVTKGVLAFGLFSTGVVVFVDECITNKRAIEESVKRACESLEQLPNIEYTAKSFLRPTCGKQGDQLINNGTRMTGTLGMVARANVKKDAEKKCSCDGRDSEVEREDVIVGLTSGHYFNEGNGADYNSSTASRNPQPFGRCIASLPPPGTDLALIRVIEGERFSFNFSGENNQLCNCVLNKEQMNISDIVYKRGARTGLTQGYILSPDFRVGNSEETVPMCRMQDGYLIQGNKEPFAEEGDSGSIVFFPDTTDVEKETAKIASIQSSLIPKEKAEKMNFPENVCYSVRVDKCFEKLQTGKRITVTLPTKQDMVS